MGCRSTSRLKCPDEPPGRSRRRIPFFVDSFLALPRSSLVCLPIPGSATRAGRICPGCKGDAFWPGHTVSGPSTVRGRGIVDGSIARTLAALGYALLPGARRERLFGLRVELVRSAHLSDADALGRTGCRWEYLARGNHRL